MSKRLLSSKDTFYFKYVLPTLWICGWGLGILALWLGGFHDTRGAPPPPLVPYGFTFIFLCGSIFLLRFSSRLVRVELQGKNLVVSNSRKSVIVPCKAIENVSVENPSMPMIVLTLREPAALGNRIVFLPPTWPPGYNGGARALVAELRSLAGLGGE
jgi:hypothetical protein